MEKLKTLRVKFSFWLCALAMLTPLFFQSCLSEKEIEASVDDMFLNYSGPSYDFPSDTSFETDVNFGVVLIFAIVASELGDYSYNYSPNEPVYASIANMKIPYSLKYNRYLNYYNLIQKRKKASSFKDNIFIKTKFEYVGKHTKDGGTKINLNYLEIPVCALYMYPLKNDAKIFGGLGPYFAYGIGGKETSNFNGQSFSSASFDSKTGLNRFDAGLTFNAGYKMPQSFSFSLGFDLGLANIERGRYDKAKTRTISLNVGYSLDKLFKGGTTKKTKHKGNVF